jgi:transmembrane sensor
MSPGDAQIREVIGEQASEWFVENRRGPMNPEESARFMAWLQASPMHVEMYLKIAAIAPDLATAAKGTQTALETLLLRAKTDNVRAFDPSASEPAPDANRRHRPQMWALAAAIALFFVAAMTIWLMRDGQRFGLPRTYATVIGEQRTQLLPDGSVMHLNTDSAVTVRYSHGERAVSVDRGQALFEVVHIGQQQFRVQAGRAAIIAVGTQFDVYRQSGTVRITVVEGTVAVVAGPPPSRLPADLREAQAVRVDAGNQVEVGERIGEPRHVDPRAAVAWLSQQIAFEDEPLGQVAAEFNRYGQIPLVIDDNSLRGVPISGVFDAYDIDTFAAFLATLKDVVVQKTPARIRVITRATAEREQLSVTR